MDDLNLSVRIDDSRSLCIAPLSAKMFREARANGLGGEYGYFIFEVDDRCPSGVVNVIGKAASADAAYQLFQLLTGDRTAS